MGLRQALSEPTCTTTHFFIGPLRLTQRYLRPAGQNRHLQEAQRVADAEPGDQWKRVFMAQICLKRGKRGLFYLEENEAQNAVNNWFNSTSHNRNLRWAVERREREWGRETNLERHHDTQPAHSAEPQNRRRNPAEATHE